MQKYINWSKESLIELDSMYSTTSVSDIAKKFNKPISSVYAALIYIKRLVVVGYWTNKEILFLTSHYSNQSNSDLRNSLRRSEDDIAVKARELGLFKDHIWTDRELSELQAMKLAGCTYKQMSELLNKSQSMLNEKLTSIGLSKQVKKWSKKELTTIEYMATKGGYTYTDIAIEVNATPEQVNNVCAYHRWNKNIKRSSSRGEKLLGNLLEKYFSQYTIIPQFYISNGQRIDFFIPELNLAWEYDGEQHSKFTPAFHKTEENFDHCQILDKTKELKCDELGIQLIRINFNEQLTIETINNKFIQYGAGQGSVDLEQAKTNNGVYEQSTLALQESKEYNRTKRQKQRKRYLQSDKHKKRLSKAKEYRHKKYLEQKEAKAQRG